MNESYTVIYRLAVREALRAELGKAIREIEASTHVLVKRQAGRRLSRSAEIYCVGTRQECETFADGLRGVVIVEISTDIRDRLISAKLQAYRGAKQV